ncbi:MAG: hypothetical protein AB7O96_15820 [Pseudobdellovibrionaceae bacterium]
MNTNGRNYFEHNKLNLRKLRHDLASAIQVADLMARFSDEKPEKKAEYSPLLREAIKRLQEIQESLCNDNANKLLQEGQFVEVSKKLE